MSEITREVEFIRSIKKDYPGSPIVEKPDFGREREIDGFHPAISSEGLQAVAGASIEIQLGFHNQAKHSRGLIDDGFSNKERKLNPPICRRDDPRVKKR